MPENIEKQSWAPPTTTKLASCSRPAFLLFRHFEISTLVYNIISFLFRGSRKTVFMPVHHCFSGNATFDTVCVATIEVTCGEDIISVQLTENDETHSATQRKILAYEQMGHVAARSDSTSIILHAAVKRDENVKAATFSNFFFPIEHAFHISSASNFLVLIYIFYTLVTSLKKTVKYWKDQFPKLGKFCLKIAH